MLHTVFHARAFSGGLPCVQVLEELMGEESLEKFRGEYEKLLSALKKSDANEKRLMVKCRELKSEILANASKLSEVMKLSQDDQANIAALRKVCCLKRSSIRIAKKNQKKCCLAHQFK